MKTPDWYKYRIKEVKLKKRTLTSAKMGELFDGEPLTYKRRKEITGDLRKEKRSCKRAEKQDLRKEIDEEIFDWKKRKKH
jgi:hypothetical protein